MTWPWVQPDKKYTQGLELCKKKKGCKEVVGDSQVTDNRDLIDAEPSDLGA